MDGNKDGVVTLSEFLEAYHADPDISTSMAALDTAFWHSARPRYMPWTWRDSLDLGIYRSTLYLTSWTRGMNFLKVYYEDLERQTRVYVCEFPGSKRLEGKRRRFFPVTCSNTVKNIVAFKGSDRRKRHVSTSVSQQMALKRQQAASSR